MKELWRNECEIPGHRVEIRWVTTGTVGGPKATTVQYWCEDCDKLYLNQTTPGNSPFVLVLDPLKKDWRSK